MFENFTFGSRGIGNAFRAVAAAMLQESGAPLWDGGKPVGESCGNQEAVVLAPLVPNLEQQAQ